jgi:hypothetical protein
VTDSQWGTLLPAPCRRPMPVWSLLVAVIAATPGS